MKNEKMLERCLNLALYLSEDDAANYNFFLNHKDECSAGSTFGIGGELAALIHDLRDDIAAESCKAAGRSGALNAAKRIIKSAKSKSKTYTHGSWMEGDKQCYCDGYRGVRLKEALPTDPVPETEITMTLANVVNPARENAGAVLNLPTISELKAHIKIEKAMNKGKAGKVGKGLNGATWDFGEGLPMVDATFLLDMLELLPGCKAVGSKVRPELGPIYFESDAGDGVLLPVRKVKEEAAS